MAREPQLVCVVGMRGVGKTYTTKDEIKRYILSDTRTGRSSRPVIVIDVNGEYEGYKAIDFDIDEPNEHIRAEQIRAITVPKPYRILTFHKNHQPMTPDEIISTCATVAKYFRNGLIVMEDINRYMLSNIKVDIIGLLVGLRHLGTDLIIHYQGLKAVPPRMWTNANYIRVHKYTENLDVFKERIPNYEICKLAEIIVQTQHRKGNIRYYVWCGIQDEKLIPCSDVGFNEIFEDACVQYLSINKRDLRDYMDLTDREGTKKFSGRPEALNAWISERKVQYLTNPPAPPEKGG